MARLLQDRDSSALHVNLARRHQRLARRYRQPGFAAAVEPAVAALLQRMNAAADQDLERQGAYDDVLAADGDQDDAVRSCFDAGKIFDRAHPEAPVLPTLFPEGGFGDLIAEPLDKEPDGVDALAVKVESLGAGHPLFAQGAPLRAAAAGVREAIRLQGEAVRAGKAADAEEEIAQAALRRGYEANYFDARKRLGRTLAEKLFPAVRAAGATPTPPAEPTPPAASPAS